MKSVVCHAILAGWRDPQKIPARTEPMTGAINACNAFDERAPGWIKVALEPVA